MDNGQIYMEEGYHQKLGRLMDEYVHGVYSVTKKFPREELYGTTSQFRRATLSVVLNYIEGYSRGREKVYKNFLEISLGSLKESRYLIGFCFKEGYLENSDYNRLLKQANEISAMLLGTLRNM
jgi:S23 ribosomal protein.